MIREAKPLVSIVILNYNGKQFLEPCLKSVLATDYPSFEVVFVDNASNDGSIELVEKMFGLDPRLKIIRNNKNLGCAEGFNVGSRLAKGKYIAFLASDTEVDNNWLKDIVNAMESDPAIGVAQPKYLYVSDNREIIDFAGGFLDPYGLTYPRGQEEEDRDQYNEIEEIFYTTSSAMIIRKSLLDKLGLFDPSFYIYSEDVDYCWRVRLAGYKIIFVPKSKVYHLGKWERCASYHQSMRHTLTFHSYKNTIMTRLKNYGIRYLAKYFPPYIVFLFSGSLYASLKDYSMGIQHFMLFMRALVWNLLNFKYIWKKRLEVQIVIRKLSDEEVFEKLRASSSKAFWEWRANQRKILERVIYKKAKQEELKNCEAESLIFSPTEREVKKHAFCSSPHESHMKIITNVGKGKKVLDVGCSSGYLSKRFKENGCYVVGIEIDEESAIVAKQYCDDVIVGDVEQIEKLPYPEGFFDVIVYGDILEHLKRPDFILMKFRKYLSADGHVVASIPNIAYWRSRLKLLIGRFDYDDFPGLDKTHIRFFTLKTAKALFESTGYRIVKIDYTGWASRLRLFRILPTLFAFQFIIVAMREESQTTSY